MDQLTSMAVFAAAADLGSFTKAAEAFDISPTMVAKHVRALEARLGARLIQRTTRAQSLTEVGRAYLERCRQVLQAAQAADAVAGELIEAPRGDLKLLAPVTYGARRVAPALAEYLRRYPEVTASLVLSDRTADLAEEGFDAAIRIERLKDSGLVARPLGLYRMWLCASPEYLAAFGAPTAPRDLARHRCLGFAQWSKKDVWRLGGPTPEAVTVRNALVINNGEALRAAAVAGAGVILQPEVLLKDDVAAGRLVRLLQGFEPPPRPIQIVYPRDRHPTPKLRSFIDFTVRALAD